jgi:hypothetical protein
MILLQSISLNRFRGVQSGTVRGLTDVNLLIGRNNSGKTTVLCMGGGSCQFSFAASGGEQ